MHLPSPKNGEKNNKRSEWEWLFRQDRLVHAVVINNTQSLRAGPGTRRGRGLLYINYSGTQNIEALPCCNYTIRNTQPFQLLRQGQEELKSLTPAVKYFGLQVTYTLLLLTAHWPEIFLCAYLNARNGKIQLSSVPRRRKPDMGEHQKSLLQRN